MRRTFLLALIGILAATLFILPACDSGSSGGGGTTRTLVGTWTCVQSNWASEVGRVWVFYPGGTGTYNGGPITWSLTGSSLTLSGLPFSLAWLTDTKVQITNLSNGVWAILVKTS